MHSASLASEVTSNHDMTHGKIGYVHLKKEATSFTSFQRHSIQGIAPNLPAFFSLSDCPSTTISLELYRVHLIAMAKLSASKRREKAREKDRLPDQKVRMKMTRPTLMGLLPRMRVPVVRLQTKVKAISLTLIV